MNFNLDKMKSAIKARHQHESIPRKLRKDEFINEEVEQEKSNIVTIISLAAMGVLLGILGILALLRVNRYDKSSEESTEK